jgi:hypothetical protein
MVSFVGNFPRYDMTLQKKEVSKLAPSCMIFSSFSCYLPNFSKIELNLSLNYGLELATPDFWGSPSRHESFR